MGNVNSSDHSVYFNFKKCFNSAGCLYNQRKEKRNQFMLLISSAQEGPTFKLSLF